MVSMRERSLMMKKRIAPLVATEVYCSRILATFAYICLLSIIFSLISSAAYCEFFKVSISSISSRIV